MAIDHDQELVLDAFQCVMFLPICALSNERMFILGSTESGPEAGGGGWRGGVRYGICNKNCITCELALEGAHHGLFLTA